MKKQMLLILSFFFVLTSLWAQESLDESFSQPTDLTDEEARASQTFLHEGVKERSIREGCANNGLGQCNPSDAEPQGFMGVVEQNIGKAYAMVFGGGIGLLSGGNGPKIKMKPKPGKETDVKADGKKDENEQDDYCMYGAIAWETLAGLMQSNLQKSAQQENSQIKDAQVAALVNLRETHKAREKTANYQSVAYGAVTACYVYYGTTGAVTDWKYWGKLGGAAALTALYLDKASKHGKAAGKVQAVIDGLPKPGDCNPWTGTSCFCKEPSSKQLYASQYQDVCVLNNGDFNRPKAAMGCGTMVDGKMQFDKECKCKATNSCFTTKLRPFNPQFNVGQNFMNQANNGFDLLASGEYDQAKLNSYSTQATAMAMKLKDKAKVKAPLVKLTEAQKRNGEIFKQVMPDNIAAIAAAAKPMNPPSGGLMGKSTSSALDNLPEPLKKKISEAAIKGNYKSGGSSSGESIAEEEWTPPVMPGQEKSETSSGTEIISFADKAISNADVSNAPDTPIFDIISNRYRRSGWEKLHAEEQIK